MQPLCFGMALLKSFRGLPRDDICSLVRLVTLLDGDILIVIAQMRRRNYS